MKASQKNDEIYKALFELSKVVMNITRNAKNDFFNSKYVPLDRILEVVREPASDAGLLITSSPSFKDGVVSVETRLIHAGSSQWVAVTPASPVVPTLTKKYDQVSSNITAQGVGAAITYLRRYGLMSLLGLAETDDDGSLASGTPRDERSSWTGPLDLQELTKELRSLWRTIEKIQDIDKLDPILWGYQETITQCKNDLPDRWDGIDGVKGIQMLIDQKRKRLTPEPDPMTPEMLLEEIENRISGITALDDLEVIRREYDEHAGLALPDIREAAQDIFSVKQIEIQAEETASEGSDTGNDGLLDPAAFHDHLRHELNHFTDYDELAAWADLHDDDIKAVPELNTEVIDKLAALKDDA